jgi:hypothetical protein
MQLGPLWIDMELSLKAFRADLPYYTFITSTPILGSWGVLLAAALTSLLCQRCWLHWLCY